MKKYLIVVLALTLLLTACSGRFCRPHLHRISLFPALTAACKAVRAMPI